MNNSRPAAPKPTIKGSWEDLLAQGQQMAANMNDEAIPTLRKVYRGLLKLPKKQRTGANNRLQSVFVQAAVGLHGYLNMRDQFDESLEIVSSMIDLAAQDEHDPAEVEFWEDRYINTLLLPGRTEEAIEKLQADAEKPDSDLGDWGTIVMTHVDNRDFAVAESVLEKIQERLATTSTDESESTDGEEDGDRDTQDGSTSAEDHAYLEGLRSIVALEAGNWEAGIAHFEQAMALGDVYANNMQFLYARLATHGQLEEAMRFVERDKNYPIRRGFWRGLILHKLGHLDDAKRAWRAVTKTQPSESERRHFLEYILSHYYLGDPEGQGLSTVLQTLRESERPAWAFFILAGVGWAVRGDLKTARNNLHIALMQYKANAYGRKLPESNWQMIEDLFDPDVAAQLQEFFMHKADNAAPSPSSSEDAEGQDAEYQDAAVDPTEVANTENTKAEIANETDEQ